MVVHVKDLKKLSDEERNDIIEKAEDISVSNYSKWLVIKSGDIEYKLTKYELDVLAEKIPDSRLRKALHVIKVQFGEVPFALVDQVPLYEGCKGVPKEEQRACFSSKLNAFIGDNFNTKLAKQLGLKGNQRIYVIFKINKEGKVTGIKVRARHPDLEAEAKRVISMLPKMMPAQYKGKVVAVGYSLPILLNVSNY
ncbi:MAG: energy transducer TonB [Flavobacteriaceae bacterium]|nr:energy transducer TonB [Flavobacteriaceae bacterium]